MDRVWRRQLATRGRRLAVSERIRKIIADSRADERCQNLYEGYKEEAVRSLAHLENPSLKGLLRRVVAKIFNDLQVKGRAASIEKRRSRRLNHRSAPVGIVRNLPRVDGSARDPCDSGRRPALPRRVAARTA
jgi:hypothetical protein